MTTDTTRTIEITGSPVRLLKLLGAAIAMTGVSAAVAIPLIGGPPPGLFLQVVGWFGTVFFGVGIVVAIVRLVNARKPVLTISPQGIRDTRVAADMIPWSAVTNISTWEAFGQKAMVLAVDPAIEAKLLSTRKARLMRDANRAVGADGLAITAAGLKIDYPELLQTGMDYWKAARQRR